MPRFTSFTVPFRYYLFFRSSGCGSSCEEIEAQMIA